MTETCELPLRIVLSVLRTHQVTVSADGNQYIFAKGERVESFKFVESVSRHMIQKIARTYKIPIHEFYGAIVAGPAPIDAVKKKPLLS